MNKTIISLKNFSNKKRERNDEQEDEEEKFKGPTPELNSSDEETAKKLISFYNILNNRVKKMEREIKPTQLSYEQMMMILSNLMKLQLGMAWSLGIIDEDSMKETPEKELKEDKMKEDKMAPNKNGNEINLRESFQKKKK